MPFVIKKGSDFVPAPEGVHAAVCVDVVDLGIVSGPWGNKHKLKIVFEIEATMPSGERFTVHQRYTVSLHEKAALRKDLKSWRGRDFTPEELDGFDVEKCIGAPCQVIVEHSEKEGTVYANVTKVLKAGPKRLKPSGKYVRHKDRPESQAASPAAGDGFEGDTDYGDSEPAQDDGPLIPF
jgi:hypothetical protein